MSSSDEYSLIEMPESTESASTETMEAHIDNMHDEIEQLHQTTDKLNN